VEAVHLVGVVHLVVVVQDQVVVSLLAHQRVVVEFQVEDALVQQMVVVC